MSTKDRAAGCLFGLAIGDALGAPTEFLQVNEILRRWPPDGPTTPSDKVTDDTQMMLAVGEALLEAEQPYTAATLEAPLRRAFIEWYNSPDNDRAPGVSCLNACEKLARNLPWYEATTINSKGCGANMRVAPVGLLKVDEVTRAAIAQFQAALTHGHATGLAASDLTAKTIAFLVAGHQPPELPALLREYALTQREVYHAAWLSPLWQRPGATLWQRPSASSPEKHIARGWDECLAILDRLDAALVAQDRASDPCLATGEGWIAEEAFATGLLCFLLYPDQPVAAIRRAAVTKGDSDSIACLAGAFAGAYLGLEAWPEAWVAKIEYRSRLEALSRALS